jgi:hypothetical protein
MPKESVRLIDYLNPGGKAREDLADGGHVLFNEGGTFDTDRRDVGVVVFGVDADGKSRPLKMAGGSLEVGGKLLSAVEDLLEQQKITNDYLLLLVGEDNRHEDHEE